MKLYAWAIIAFRKLKTGDVSFEQYIFWSEAPDADALAPVIASAIRDKFPASAGWFDATHNITEYKGHLFHA